MNIQGWFPLRLTGLITLLSRVFSTFWKRQFFCAPPILWSNSHIQKWLLEKPWLWLYGPLSVKCCLCFLICCLGWSQLFFQGESHFLISWLQSPSTVILEPKKIKFVSFHLFSIYCYEVMGPDAMILVFWMLSFKPAFLLSSFIYYILYYILYIVTLKLQ